MINRSENHTYCSEINDRLAGTKQPTLEVEVSTDDLDQQRADWEGMSQPVELETSDAELRRDLEEDLYNGATAG